MNLPVATPHSVNTQAARSAPLQYCPVIDGLRAVAVLAVIAFHASPRLFPAGYLGVDVFFVISGYLLTRIAVTEQQAGQFSWRNFYLRRVRRIAPALITVMVATLVLAACLMQPLELRQFGASLATASLWVSNLYFWRQTGYFNEAAGAQPLLHTWSLGIEEQFYLLFPLLLWLRQRRGLWPIFGLLLASVLLHGYWQQHRPAAAFFLLPTRAWELLAGCVLAALQSARNPCDWDRWCPPWLLVAAQLTLVLTVLGAAPHRLGMDGINQLLTVLATLGILTGTGTVGAGVTQRLLGARPLVAVGLMSYSLYLWHQPVLTLLQLRFGAHSPWLTLTALHLTAVLSWASWRWVETPWRRRDKGPHFLPCVALASATLALCGAGLWFNAGAWLPPTDAHRRLAEFRYDYAQAYALGDCFLREDQGPADFDACTTAGTGDGSTLLWGDSYAAHWLPGLQSRPELYASLKQRTASACPPALASAPQPAGAHHCAEVRQHVLTEIAAHRPDRILLSARWGEESIAQLPGLVAELRRMGVQDVLVLGPTPRWRGGLPGWLLAADDAQPAAATSLRPPHFVDQGNLALQVAEVSRQAGATPIDLWSAACPDAPRCTVRLSVELTDLVYWDEGHLTLRGSLHLAAHLRWPSPGSAVRVNQAR